MKLIIRGTLRDFNGAPFCTKERGVIAAQLLGRLSLGLSGFGERRRRHQRKVEVRSHVFVGLFLGFCPHP